MNDEIDELRHTHVVTSLPRNKEASIACYMTRQSSCDGSKQRSSLIMSKKSEESITYGSVDGTAENRDSNWSATAEVSFVFSEMNIEVSEAPAAKTALTTRCP